MIFRIIISFRTVTLELFITKSLSLQKKKKMNKRKSDFCHKSKLAAKTASMDEGELQSCVELQQTQVKLWTVAGATSWLFEATRTRCPDSHVPTSRSQYCSLCRCCRSLQCELGKMSTTEVSRMNLWDKRPVNKKGTIFIYLFIFNTFTLQLGQLGVNADWNSWENKKCDFSPQHFRYEPAAQQLFLPMCRISNKTSNVRSPPIDLNTMFLGAGATRSNIGGGGACVCVRGSPTIGQRKRVSTQEVLRCDSEVNVGRKLNKLLFLNSHVKLELIICAGVFS